MVVVVCLCLCTHYVAGNQLGVYCSNPNGNDQQAMEYFEKSFDRFTAVMGVRPSYMNAFIDYSKGWDTWVQNAEWTSWSWTKSNRSANLIPVIGVPMLPSSYYNTEGAGLDEVISGKHDDVFVGIVKAFGQNFHTLHLRIGWEMNGNWYAWNFNGKNSTGGSILPQWIAAWRHIATVMRGATPPGGKVYTTWNPTIANWAPFDVSSGYPGDDVVDVIALDAYSTVWPGALWDWEFNNGTVDPSLAAWSKKDVNREHYWNYPGANQWEPTSLGGWGMVAHLQFAKQHSKPIAFCESGVGVNPSYPNNGLVDDGDFPRYLKAKVDSSGVTLIYINIWDVNEGDGGWCFSDPACNKPKTAAAWKAAFGA